ncbi:MAG: RpiB/LacA/LacB family sugar-phosphate isomerase [Candidatus Paceibacterota bacterium]
MVIYVGADHAGFALKEALKVYLMEKGYEVNDMGAHEFKEDDDYPDLITPLAKKIVHEASAVGIIFGGSGQGEAMCANREKGVRAAVYYGGDENIIKLSREHNDANILSLGARFLNEEEAKEAITLWLETPFLDEERHARRIKKIDREF